MKDKERIIVALDCTSWKEAEQVIKNLNDKVGFFKVGIDLITVVGPLELTKRMHEYNAKIFFDAKFYDILNKITQTPFFMPSMNADMFSIHALSGIEAMRKANQEKGDALLLGETPLISISKKEHYEQSSTILCSLTENILKAGLDGVICSCEEFGIVSQFDLLKIVQGTIPEWAQTNEQKRTMTPVEAIDFGADYIVIGESVTRPPKGIGTSLDALNLIIEEIGG